MIPIRLGRFQALSALGDRTKGVLRRVAQSFGGPGGPFCTVSVVGRNILVALKDGWGVGGAREKG